MSEQKGFAKIVLVGLVVVIIGVFSYVALRSYKQPPSRDDSGHLLPNSVYENSKYKFRLTYPEGSIFVHANPESGFVTRFFLPKSQTIAGDQENIGMYIKEKSGDLGSRLKEVEGMYKKNGPLDIEEVQFGGQKGYRVIFTSNYTAPKHTKELAYMTVKDGTLFELNYFPVVDQSLGLVDTVARSFEFIQ